MKTCNFLWMFILLIFSTTLWAYGGGSSSSTKACIKPKFTEFSPADKSEVAAKSVISFVASEDANPESIKVTAKELPVALTITPENEGSFLVTGNLPETLKDTFARISISAEGHNKCKGTGGWLVKITQ